MLTPTYLLPLIQNEAGRRPLVYLGLGYLDMKLAVLDCDGTNDGNSTVHLHIKSAEFTGNLIFWKLVQKVTSES